MKGIEGILEFPECLTLSMFPLLSRISSATLQSRLHVLSTSFRNVPILKRYENECYSYPLHALTYREASKYESHFWCFALAIFSTKLKKCARLLKMHFSRILIQTRIKRDAQFSFSRSTFYDFLRTFEIYFSLT